MSSSRSMSSVTSAYSLFRFSSVSGILFFGASFRLRVLLRHQILRHQDYRLF